MNELWMNGHWMNRYRMNRHPKNGHREGAAGEKERDRIGSARYDFSIYC